MADADDEVFGSAQQQAFLRRGRAMYDLLEHDPRYTYYGRGVGLATPDDGSLDRLAALVALQGNSSLGTVPDGRLPSLCDAVEARGLSVTRYARWAGGTDALAAARGIVADTPPPDDLTLCQISPATRGDALEQLAAVALACGVVPPAGAVLRGVRRPGVAFVALDCDGRGVACAGAAAFLHSDLADDDGYCWWGMLATLPERRGARLSLLLGAMAMIAMYDRYGATSFFTGVEVGNSPSEAVCTRIGLRPEGASILVAADPSLIPGGRLTK
jgi:hypothetical protein